MKPNRPLNWDKEIRQHERKVRELRRRRTELCRATDNSVPGALDGVEDVNLGILQINRFLRYARMMRDARRDDPDGTKPPGSKPGR